MRTGILALGIAFLLHSPLPVAAGNTELPTVKELIRRMDQLYRADTSEAEMTMSIRTENWSRSLRMRAWSRGMDETLIRILEPRREKGISTLRIDKEMWNYFPKIDRVIKVPPSMMSGNWMGSDFTNDDLVRETSYEEDYDTVLEKRDGLFVLVMNAKPDTATVWERMEISVDRKSLLPVEHAYFDGKGRKARSMTFTEIREFSGRRIPSVMTMKPLGNEKRSTRIEYHTLKFGVKLPEGFFSLRSLKKR